MISFNNKITPKKLKSLKKIEFLLNNLNLKWRYFDINKDNKYKAIIEKEYKNLHLKNNLYKIIIVEDLPNEYLDNDSKVNYLFLWVSIFQTDIRINRVSLFDNNNGLSLIKILDLNNLCRFSIFSVKLTKEDKKIIKMVEDRWTKAKIPWHRITKEESYDYHLISSNLKLFGDWRKRCKLINTYVFDNSFFYEIGFTTYDSISYSISKLDKKIEKYQDKYSELSCYRYNYKEMLFLDLKTKCWEEKFYSYFLSFVDDVNSKCSYTD